MKRRNVYNFIATNKLRRALKRNKTNDGVGFIFRLFGGIGVLILFDFLSDLRVELIYPLYLFVSEFNDIFRFKGFLYLLCYMFLALTVDMICYYFLTIHWLLFTSSSIVWFQFIWESERGYTTSTLPIWLSLCGFEFFVRCRQIKPSYSITQEISRPFSAHGVGYPIFMLCFFCKNFIFYRIKVFRRRGIRRENEALMELMRNAITSDDQKALNSDAHLCSPRYSFSSCSSSPTLSSTLTSCHSSQAQFNVGRDNEDGNDRAAIAVASSAVPPPPTTATITANGDNSIAVSHKSNNGHATSTNENNAHPTNHHHHHHHRSISSPAASPSPAGVGVSALVNNTLRSSLSSQAASQSLPTTLITKILVSVNKLFSFNDFRILRFRLFRSVFARTLKTLRIHRLLEHFVHCANTAVLSLVKPVQPTKQLSPTEGESKSGVSNVIIKNNGASTADIPDCSAGKLITKSSCNGHSTSTPVNSNESQEAKRKNSLETNGTTKHKKKDSSKNKVAVQQTQHSNSLSTEDPGIDALLKMKEEIITNLKYQNNKLQCDVEITQQAKDDLYSQLKNSEKSAKLNEKRYRGVQTEVATLQKRIQSLNTAKQQDKATIQKLEKSLEEECKRHKVTAEQHTLAESRAQSALETIAKANSFAENVKNKCRDSCNKQRREYEFEMFALQQELARRKEKELQQEQLIKELRERVERLSLLGTAYHEKLISLEKQISCLNSEKYEMKGLLNERENEILELRQKLHRMANINKTFGNGFSSISEFEQQIATNRESVNRCFSSCSPSNSNPPRASPSAFSSPTPPMSMLGAMQNMSPNSTGVVGASNSKLVSNNFQLPNDSDNLIRSAFRLTNSNQTSAWPTTTASSLAPTSGGAMIRFCDTSTLGAVGSERESASGRHSSQSNCSNRIRSNNNSGVGLNASATASSTGPSTSVTPTAVSNKSGSSPSIGPIGNGNVLSSSLSRSSASFSKTYDDFFADDSVFDLSASNNSQNNYF